MPDYFVKLAALDQLHAEVAVAIALADFVDRDDAWMFKTGGGFGFATKTLYCASVAQWPKPITFSATVRLRLFVARGKLHPGHPCRFPPATRNRQSR